MTIKKIKIKWVVNGQPQDLKHSVEQTLGDAYKEALKATGTADRYINDREWWVRDANGVLLETRRKIGEFKFTPGVRLFVSLGVGAGGSGIDAA